MIPNSPSSNPANLDTLTGSFREIIAKALQNTENMLPAQVVGYTAGPPARVQVQPLIQLITTGGQIINRAQISSIPVLQLGGGGFFIHFPLKAGDLGWIMANDRDISTFLQNYSQSPPNTYRTHSFSDAIFVPDVMKNYTVSEGDENNLVISSTDGYAKVTLSGSGNTSTVTVLAPYVNITSSVEVNITAPLVNITNP